MTPSEAIRHYCLECCCDEMTQISKCTAAAEYGPSGCWLWPYRSGHGKDSGRPGHLPFTRVKAIHENCLSCMGYRGGSAAGRSSANRLVRECDTVGCPVWSFRDGRNPSRKGLKGNVEALHSARIAKQALRKGLVPPKTE